MSVTRPALLGLAIAAASWGAASLRVAAQEPEPAKAPAVDVAELFRASCLECHLAPDPAVRTDQAWIEQVNETA